MPLPDLVEITPLAALPRAEITVPGSKSLTNRALVLAALGEGRTQLTGALWSEDTQVMVEALRRLGWAVAVEPDPNEPGNRRLTIEGQSGHVPKGGTHDQPLELFVGNAGTAARFLAALVCLGSGWYRLAGVPRMHERPQAELFAALRQLGYRIESPNDRLPALIQGGGPRAGRCAVSIQESSQFASALLLCAGRGGWQVTVAGANADEAPYVEMTRALCRVFPRQGGEFVIEPDASSGSYFYAVNALWGAGGPDWPVRVRHWPASGWQVDARFPELLPLRRPLSRATDLGDSIMMAIVLAPLAEQPLSFVDLGRLRVQECERVTALRTELARCGALVREKGDTLEFVPGPLRGAEIETYGDHRMAMCFAVLGLKVPGIRLRQPTCVKKSFPNFFQKLALPPPEGLGAVVRDARSGRVLPPAELTAE
ncbi:MAG: 3-phosphoshikimate 1-carboxyvinyltransferase [Verrucomicrobiae bacterium]|nr:3-phosphoshikimate 1-carboxyvinyltransferase [Verrucomicrobiae bacterium]